MCVSSKNAKVYSLSWYRCIYVHHDILGGCVSYNYGRLHILVVYVCGGTVWILGGEAGRRREEPGGTGTREGLAVNGCLCGQEKINWDEW